MRVNADRDRCVGGGLCTHTAPNLFDQDEKDGRVLLLGQGHLTAADVEAAGQAVALCPAAALSLREGGDGTTADAQASP